MKAPYPSSQAVLYHMSDTGLLFHIHGVQLPRVRCHVPDSKRICHEALPLMRMLQPRFQSQNIPAAQPDSWSAGILHSQRMSNIRSDRPERIERAVMLRLILLWLNIRGISVCERANPRLCICGRTDVSLPVYRSTLKFSDSILSARIRSCSAALTLIYCCATSAFHAWRPASGNV